MQRKKVILHIRGMQFDVSRNNEEESGAIETVTTGVMRKISAPSTARAADGEAGKALGPEDRYIIKYEEIQEDFGQVSSVLLKASPGRLEMAKRGLLNVRMEFEDGKYSQSEYSTPFGELLFGLHTRRVTVDEQADGVQIRASYMMEMNGEFLADSVVEILAEYAD